MARRIEYRLSAFDRSKVEAGTLMVMVRSDYSASEGATIANILYYEEATEGHSVGEGYNNPCFGGAGIAYNVEGYNMVFMKVNGITHKFNNEGQSLDTFTVDNVEYHWHLWAATVGASNDSAGNVISSAQNSITIRFEDEGTGEVAEETTTTYNSGSSVVINSLNARDQFAVQALRGMLPTLKNPLEVSDTIIDYYCAEAYRWANTMMSVSASSRASLEDQTQTTSAVDVGVLEDDTDKLLNNLIAELERTDTAEVDSSSTIYYKRVALKNMSDVLDKLQAQNTALTNINTQLSNMYTLLNSKLEAQNTALNLIATNISNLAPASAQE